MPDSNHSDSQKCFWVLFCILSLSIQLGCNHRREPEIKKSVGENKAWFNEYFNREFVTIVREGNAVRFVPRVYSISDKLESDDTQKGHHPNSFCIKQSEIFRQPIDDHGWTSFVVKDIRDDAVVIEYESGFNHSSFGENLITIDTGTVVIPYYIGPKPKRLPGTFSYDIRDLYSLSQRHFSYCECIPQVGSKDQQ